MYLLDGVSMMGWGCWRVLNDVNWIIANIVGARLYQGQQIRKKKNNDIDL